MTAAEILGQLGLTLPALRATAASYEVLARLGATYTTFESFFEAWTGLGPQAFTGPVLTAWRAAQFWSNQQRYLAQWSPQPNIPLSFQAVLPRSANERAGEANYRYVIRIDITFPKTGDRQPMWVNVDSDTPLSWAAAKYQAFDRLLAGFQPTTLPPADVDEYEYFDPSFYLAGFYRLTG